MGKPKRKFIVRSFLTLRFRIFPWEKNKKEVLSDSESLLEIYFKPVNEYPKLRRDRDEFSILWGSISTFVLKNYLVYLK